MTYTMLLSTLGKRVKLLKEITIHYPKVAQYSMSVASTAIFQLVISTLYEYFPEIHISCILDKDEDHSARYEVRKSPYTYEDLSSYTVFFHDFIKSILTHYNVSVRLHFGFSPTYTQQLTYGVDAINSIIRKLEATTGKSKFQSKGEVCHFGKIGVRPPITITAYKESTRDFAKALNFKEIKKAFCGHKLLYMDVILNNVAWESTNNPRNDFTKLVEYYVDQMLEVFRTYNNPGIVFMRMIYAFDGCSQNQLLKQAFSIAMNTLGLEITSICDVDVYLMPTVAGNLYSQHLRKDNMRDLETREFEQLDMF